ncbi:MAG: FAD-binding oxidoreductase [Spirochaetes bacterium]|nr:FAD-binding oxidoreductase [Spirochaetota bacterium]
MGGMVSGAVLSRINKKRVLILEQHYEIGGFTHEFSRGKYKWDVGLHHVGKLQKKIIGRILYDYLTEDNLKWHKLPYIFDRFIYPDFQFEVPDNLKDFKARVIEKFPHEKKAIRRYFQDINRVTRWFKLEFIKKISPLLIKILISLFNFPLKRLARTITKDYLDQNFEDEKLKALLISRWGNYGTPPAESAFAFHSVVDNHYFDGAYYPIGGSSKIALHFERIIEKHGGMILTNKEVTEIVVENDIAKGVYVKDLQNNDKIHYLEAPIIISNAGAPNTLQRLLKPKYTDQLKNNITEYPDGLSMVILYMGLKQSPQTTGCYGENYWIHDSYDHNQSHNGFNLLLKGKPNSIFLSFPSLKDPEALSHCAEAICFVPYSAFEKWKGEEWKNRGNEYDLLKNRIIQELIRAIDSTIPEFSNNVEYYELSTPLTLEKFSNIKRGNMYGIPATPERLDMKLLQPKTHIQNLYLTGADICSVGILGGFLGGIATASVINGSLGFVKILVKAIRYSKQKNKKNDIKDIPICLCENDFFNNKLEAKLMEKHSLSDHVYQLTFDLNRDLKLSSHIHVKIKISPLEWRAYTVVKSKGSLITFMIDKKTGGKSANFIKNLKIGDKTLIRLPLQNLYQRHNNFKKVFIATGIGITPFVAMLNELEVLKHQERIKVFFGVSSKNENFISQFLAEKQRNLDLHIIYCSTKEKSNQDYFTGRVTKAIKKTVLDPANEEYYLCGNPVMVQESIHYLKSIGADKIYW